MSVTAFVPLTQHVRQNLIWLTGEVGGLGQGLFFTLLEAVAGGTDPDFSKPLVAKEVLKTLEEELDQYFWNDGPRSRLPCFVVPLGSIDSSSAYR